jgi:hypothetical protein
MTKRIDQEKVIVVASLVAAVIAAIVMVVIAAKMQGAAPGLVP